MSVELEDTIEPGSLEYGDRQIVEDRMQQVRAQGGRRQAPPGAATQRATDRLASGPVSDKPVTAGLSVGPGPGPQITNDPSLSPEAEKYRLMAENARNPYLRHLARNALRAMLNRSV